MTEGRASQELMGLPTPRVTEEKREKEYEKQQKR